MHPGDWVIIEFGINDGGTPLNGSTSTTGDKGRADCPGAGSETCTVNFKYVVSTRRWPAPRMSSETLTARSNTTEVVKTFPAYLEAAAKTFLSLGAAGVVISEQLPNNVWESGKYSYKPSIFSYYDM